MTLSNQTSRCICKCIRILGLMPPTLRKIEGVLACSFVTHSCPSVKAAALKYGKLIIDDDWTTWLTFEVIQMHMVACAHRVSQKQFER